MGHLVNPKSLRLGWSLNWEDSWYIQNIYYPEFFHTVQKIRLIIIYICQEDYIEDTGFMLSHFEIIQTLKTFLIKLFFYNGKFEDFFLRFITSSVLIPLKN